MARLIKANYTMEEINVIIAFIILSPDREGLVYPDRVQELQDNMLKVSYFKYGLLENTP